MGTKPNMNFLIVGCGISGATLARKLAEHSHQVTVIDTKDHIGGNCFDYFDQEGICIHKYGTHIFHTDNETVWRFLSRFTAGISFPFPTFFTKEMRPL